MDTVEVVVAHAERATLRVGGMFLKIDGDRSRLAIEIKVMGMAPVPTPRIVWHEPPVLALAALDGSALGHLGEPSPAPAAAWAATGAAIRQLHRAPLPPWPGPSLESRTARLEAECEWLLAHDVLPTEIITRNRELARIALRPWSPAFVHGDLQVDHVFIDRNEVTGVLDWSEGAQGDAMYDLATLTIGHPEYLDDVVSGYGTDVDVDVIRSWWSYRGLTSARWLIEHGFEPDSPGCEFAVLRAQV